MESAMFAINLIGSTQYLGNFEILTGGLASHDPRKNEPATFSSEESAEIALESYDYRCIKANREPMMVEVVAI